MQSVYFIPCSSPPSPSRLLALPTSGFFTLFMVVSPHPRLTGSTSMCRYPWMGGLHGSRATHLLSPVQIKGKTRRLIENRLSVNRLFSVRFLTPPVWFSYTLKYSVWFSLRPKPNRNDRCQPAFYHNRAFSKQR